VRVAILGVGGFGRTLTAELHADPRVDSILLADSHGERARVLTGIRGRVPIEARQLNVEERDVLARAIHGCDVVVNATLPRYNLTIMDVCLAAGTNYLDASAAGASTPGGKLGILEQLDKDDAFKAAGLTALVSMGIDPGISNIMAVDAAATFDRIEAIRIRSGGDVKLPGTVAFPLYSREAFLDDMFVPPTVWADNALQEREPLSEPEDFEFPPPVGTKRAFLVSHEEVKTLPRFLGKPIGRVDYNYALDPNLAGAVVALQRLGLLTDTRLVRLGSQLVPFRRAFLATFPEPSALLLPLEGSEALVVEVEGIRDGVRRIRRGEILMSHQEANRRRSTTAVHYLQAAGTAIGTVLLGTKRVPRAGVLTAESLDPAAVWAEWKARDLPIAWSERPAAS
jgi:saccharopine dehydrogenase (NAD+, L-lysine forming)